MHGHAGCASSSSVEGKGHRAGEPCCLGTSAGVRETVEEMDFQRGIWSAALDGDFDRVGNFIAKGTDPNLPDRFGYTALHYGSRHGKLSVCRLLLDSGADSNAQTHGGSTALHRAAYSGHIMVAELLLERGADPAKTDSDGRTALHKAAEAGRRELCHLLLKHNNGLLELRDCRGLTAAEMAPPGATDLFCPELH
ncbi:ankyrin repeat domain-containing protein 39 [Spea bombifrons]|uniref:ankyrin repeat domain-containing protein 39 n=1 Tax=Spea bombifrons TaxID=233779 RepID=UPI00234B2CDB|nr:ankyrin repeat domain-containing protein 39 [Spea bombifrons]